MEKINLDLLKIVLTPKEMKNITGGSASCHCMNGSVVEVDECSLSKCQSACEGAVQNCNYNIIG